MSGFTNITGFAPPTSLAGFMGLLQTASFRGAPFKVMASRFQTGRRLAVHQYPYRDGGWPEDMGRQLRVYNFTGYLIGDLAPAMQLALNTALEAKGPGILVHPTIGAVNVDVLSATSAVQRERMRVIEVALQFIEHSTTVFPLAILSTAVMVLSAAGAVLTAMGADLVTSAGSAATVGPQALGEGSTVIGSFGDQTIQTAADPIAVVGLATAIPPPDTNTSYGRYADGSVITALPADTTVASLVTQLAVQRQTLTDAAATAQQTLQTPSAEYPADLQQSTSLDNVVPNLAVMVEAARACMNDPSDQVRVLQDLAAFAYTDAVSGAVGLGAAMVTMRQAVLAACQNAAGVSLARAAAAYQPASYDDAAAVRTSVAAALDILITAAGDAGYDATYVTLKQLRSAVIQDLTVRGASLPSVVTVSMPLNMPSLAIAQRLYQDASRSDQIAAEAKAVHPAFCPRTFQALAS